MVVSWEVVDERGLLQQTQLRVLAGVAAGVKGCGCCVARVLWTCGRCVVACMCFGYVML